MDVACTIGDKAQAPRGWTRIIVEKPFGFNSNSSHQLTKSLLSKFEERQIYRSFFNLVAFYMHSSPSSSFLTVSVYPRCRIDHMLGRNLIENLTVLRFSNLVFEPLWNRTYIRNVQVVYFSNLIVCICV